jgi:hypothetical protein
MSEAPTSLLNAWTNYYVITGSAAAALTGLMFVAISIVAGRPSQPSREGVSTFSTPTVAHFSTALITSALLNVPWRSLWHAGVALGIVGLYGVVYTIGVSTRTKRQNSYEPEAEDWIWYALLPLIAYAALVGAAIGLDRRPAPALFAPAAAVLLLIVIGIHNAWDVVTYLAIEQPAGSSSSAAAGGGDRRTPCLIALPRVPPLRAKHRGRCRQSRSRGRIGGVPRSKTVRSRRRSGPKYPFRAENRWIRSDYREPSEPVLLP